MRLEPSPSMRAACLPTKAKGFSLVEVVLATALLALLLTALVGAYLYGQESAALTGNRVRATLLAEEALEAVRNLRDEAYVNLPDGTYGLATTSNQWTLTGSSDTTGVFTREVQIATVDADRKSVTATVSWQQNEQRAGTVSLVTRISNWLAVGVSNWASPLAVASIDVTGNNDGIKIQILGNVAYMVRSGGTPNFLVFDITNPDTPSLLASLTLGGTPQNLHVVGNYAYVVSNSNTQELQIVNISNPSAPGLTSSFDAPGNTDAFGVFVVSNRAYLVRAAGADSFVTVNVSAPGSPTQVGSLNLGATGYEVVVSGTYAYVASGNNAQELQVVSLATPAAPVIAGSLNLTGNTDAITVALFGSTLLLGQGSNLFTVNVATPTTPVQSGSLAVGGTLNDIALNGGAGNTYAYLATSATTNEFVVADVSVPAAPVVLGSANVAGATLLRGVAYDETLDRAVTAGALDTAEFTVFAPQ